MCRSSPEFAPYIVKKGKSRDGKSDNSMIALV